MADHEDPMSWERVDTQPGPDLGIFSVRFDFYADPRSGERIKRVVLESGDWCSIVALTPDRRSSSSVSTALGSWRRRWRYRADRWIETSAHLDAAKRELLEETGFEAGQWEYLGSSLPNTAFLDNRIHHWLAKDAVRVADPANSEHEYTQVETYPEAELAGLVHRGELEHSLGLVALSRVFDLRLPPPER